MRPAALLSVILLALAACSSAAPTETTHEGAPAGIAAGTLAVSATHEGLDVSNQTEHPVFLTAIDKETAPLVDLYLCTGGTSCHALAQGEHRLVPWPSIIGYSTARTAYVIYYWYAETGTDGQVRANGLQFVSVTR